MVLAQEWICPKTAGRCAQAGRVQTVCAAPVAGHDLNCPFLLDVQSTAHRLERNASSQFVQVGKRLRHAWPVQGCIDTRAYGARTGQASGTRCRRQHVLQLGQRFSIEMGLVQEIGKLGTKRSIEEQDFLASSRHLFDGEARFRDAAIGFPKTDGSARSESFLTIVNADSPEAGETQDRQARRQGRKIDEQIERKILCLRTGVRVQSVCFVEWHDGNGASPLPTTCRQIDERQVIGVFGQRFQQESFAPEDSAMAQCDRGGAVPFALDALPAIVPGIARGLPWHQYRHEFQARLATHPIEKAGHVDIRA